MDRRSFLQRTGAGAAALSFGPSFWQAALAAPAEPGDSPYGPLGEPDENGVRVPEGFTARIVAISTLPVGAVSRTPIDYVWPPFPDGKATYATEDGGWVVAVNSEVPRTDALRVLLGVPAQFEAGGASSLRFDADGNVVDAYAILEGTDGNCAGGRTPWGTWLSCEEPQAEPRGSGTHARGAVFECDPFRPSQGVELPAMGLFKHEAVAIDPVNGHAFLTEDESDGTLYRYVPDTYPDLSAGTLQVPRVAPDGSVTWHDVPDPLAEETRTADQVEGTTRFDGGEGIWYDQGYVYFTTKNDHRVWVHDIADQTIWILYDAADHEDTPLGPEVRDTSVDNITVSSSGDLFVAEDGGNMEVVIITADTRTVAPVVRLEGDQHGGSEVCGPTFSPDGSRLYFSSQRANPSSVGTEDPTGGEAEIWGSGMGVTYEVRGPWRTERVGIAALDGAGQPGPVPAPAPPADGGSGGAGPATPATGAGAAAIGLGAIATAAAMRRRTFRPRDPT